MVEFNLDDLTIPTLVTIANAIGEEIDNADILEAADKQRKLFEAICDNIETRVPGYPLDENVVIPENL